MNKIFSKTVKKVTLTSILLAAVVALAVVFTCIFGANYAPTIRNAKSLTVNGGYFHESNIVKVEEQCETVFSQKGISPMYELHPVVNGVDSTIVYYFAENVDLTEVEALLQEKFDTLSESTLEADSVFFGTQVTVTANSETLFVGVPVSYFVRAAVAVAIFAVLAFIYVTLRYRLDMGICVACGAVLSAVLSAAIVLLCRIPFSPSALYAITLSALVTVALQLFHFNKLRKAMKETDGEQSAEEMIVSSMALKETVAMLLILGVAVVLVGAIATTAVRWFAVAALISLVVSAALALVYLPSLYLPLKKWGDANVAKTAARFAYVGAKKSSPKKEETSAQAEETVTE